MQVVQILSHMNTGVGDTSYAKNCSVQKKIITLTKSAIEEAVEEMLSTSNCVPESMGVADLGCASAPNSFLVISEIIGLVRQKCGRSGPAEFRVYLNDLYTNDFNTLFATVPDFYNNINDGGGFGRCLVSGVPGSFYGRILPSKSVHFFHSSSSNHWLSQVPAGLHGNTKMNKGNMYISKSSPQGVLDAYSVQFRDDFNMFLRSRAEEVVVGGRMVLSQMGRIGLDPTTMPSCHHWDLLALALNSMLSEGLVEEEMVDTLNAPYYAPCPEEIKQEVEKEGSFCIRRLEALEVDWDAEFNVATFNPILSGMRVAKTIRAVVEPMLMEHGFGQHIMEDLFKRYGDLVALHMSTTRTKYINLVISLVRKP